MTNQPQDNQQREAEEDQTSKDHSNGYEPDIEPGIPPGPGAGTR